MSVDGLHKFAPEAPEARIHAMHLFKAKESPVGELKLNTGTKPGPETSEFKLSAAAAVAAAAAGVAAQFGWIQVENVESFTEAMVAVIGAIVSVYTFARTWAKR